MRVISGTARGLRLESPDGQDTRPTLDNVKEAVFSMLFDRVRDAKVLDLFAGSGALGIEALSRGASHCIFSDKSQKSVSIVKTNVTKARLTDKAEIVKADYKEVLSDCTGKDKKFDIIFLDPPYAKDFWMKLFNLYTAIPFSQKPALLWQNLITALPLIYKITL